MMNCEVNDCAMTMRAEKFLTIFQAASSLLENTKDLGPTNKTLNTVLNDFVHAVIGYPMDKTTEIQSILDHDFIREKHQVFLKNFAMAEFQMELFYARLGVLNSLNNHENYRVLVADYPELISEEIAAINLDHFDTNEMRDDVVRGEIYFIGSGPLPMTAVECARQTGRAVVCIERDQDAVEMSRRVISDLGLDHRITVKQGDGATMDYRGAGLVMLAALVDQKQDVIHAIRTTAPDAMIGIRSAEGLRTLLYKEINPKDITQHGYDLWAKSRTNDQIVNTTLFFKPVCGANKRDLTP